MVNSAEKLEFRTVRGYQLKDKRESGLTPALEDYLEMVYRQCRDGSYTRVGKLSEQLHVKPSSASKMIAKLAHLGFLKYDSCESILLTETGKATGAFLLERHTILERFLNLIGSGNALEEAELIEHNLSKPTVFKIQALLGFFDENPEIRMKLHTFMKEQAEHYK